MTIEQRVEQLERRNRRGWLVICVLLAALTGTWLFAEPLKPKRANAQAAPTARVVKANEFRVVDENGKARGTFFVNNDGVALVLWDEKGEQRVELGVTKNGPRLSFCDENGKPRAGLVVDKEGPSLGLCDENGTPRAALGAVWVKTSTGKYIRYPECSLLQFDAEGKLTWSAP